MKIDPRKNWALAEQRLATETEPLCRRNLQIVIQHMKAEASRDLDALMATVAEDARYHFYGSEDDEVFAGPKGRAEIEAFYKMVVGTGMSRIEHDVDRVLVDRFSVVTEGKVRIAYPGSMLREMGYDIDDEDMEADYLYESRQLIVWPINENGLIAGEDCYTGKDGFAGIELRKLQPDDIITVDAL